MRVAQSLRGTPIFGRSSGKLLAGLRPSPESTSRREIPLGYTPPADTKSQTLECLEDPRPERAGWRALKPSGDRAPSPAVEVRV